MVVDFWALEADGLVSCEWSDFQHVNITTKIMVELEDFRV